MRLWNRSADKVRDWIASLPADDATRVTAATSAADAVPSTDGVVFSLVSNDAALDAITTGDDGILAALGPGGIHVCLSTVSPAMTSAQAAAHASRGIAYIACPVFGRPPVAAAKKLIVVAGGDPCAITRISSLLEATSQKIVRAGDTAAAASSLKLAGNFMILATIEAQAEAYTLAEVSGVPRATAHDLLCGPTGLFATLPIQRIYGEMVAAQRYEPVGFTAENGLKDASLVCQAAEAGHLRLPIAELVRDRLSTILSEPRGAERDWASFAALVKPDSE